MKKVLNASEMKQVRGGAVPSSMCGEGEELYTCVTIWRGGSQTSGSVCATNRVIARVSVNLVYHDQGVGSDVANIRCL